MSDYPGNDSATFAERDSVSIAFPFEFIVYGTPVSLQNATTKSKERWKELVKASSRDYLPEGHFAAQGAIAVTLYYFPDAPMQGDVDNIVKLTIDAMANDLFGDDRLVERVVVQKFEPQRVFPITDPSPILFECMSGDNKPALYIRLSDNPFEDFR